MGVLIAPGLTKPWIKSTRTNPRGFSDTCAALGEWAPSHVPLSPKGAHLAPGVPLGLVEYLGTFLNKCLSITKKGEGPPY